MKPELSEKWIKAAIAGTIWAASEIVLGSFLHNLRIPFSGNILTAIGIIILISISFKWTEKGLFWRAGVICATMKTMSPSAVIFGPMIAIMAESVLLELSVRLLGKTYAGYIFGAMLAMSWNLFHKIFSYIISYGSNIVEVYTNLLNMAERQLNIKTDLVWLPIIILLIVYALFGILAAVIGIRVGRKLLKQPTAIRDYKGTETVNPVTSNKSNFNYSIIWLVIDLSMIIGVFLLLNYTPWFIWSIAVTAIIIVWGYRYKNSLRRISKPKFWAFFVLITLITAFVFSKIQPGENSVINGLLTGIQMNFRAALIVVGFSVIGTELYNPLIRDFFSRTMFKNLPLAVELSVESLPDFIASIPDFKSLVKNPVLILSQVISHADIRLAEISKNKSFNRKIFIISGMRNEGKTALAEKVAADLKSKNIPVNGILSMKVMGESQIKGYDIVDIETGKRIEFLRINEEKWKEKIGKFHINPFGPEMGEKILNPAGQSDKGLVIIDEIGILELNNKGWAGCLGKLIRASNSSILITVRDTFVDDVIKKWSLKNVVLFNVSETDPALIVKSILEHTGSAQ